MVMEFRGLGLRVKGLRWRDLVMGVRVMGVGVRVRG